MSAPVREETAAGSPWRAQFVALAFAWGSTYWFIAWGLQSFTPVQVTMVRGIIASLASLALVRVLRLRLPPDRRFWFHTAVVALLINSIPGTLVAVMQEHVSSSATAMLVAAIPLGVLMGSVFVFRDQRPTRMTIVGLFTGLLGILIFLGVWKDAPTGQWWAVLALVGVVISAGLGFPYYGRHFGRSPVDPTLIVTVQLIWSAVLLVPVAIVEEAASGFPGVDLVWQAVVGVLCLGLIVGALGNALSFRILKAAGPTAMIMVNFVVPLVAVVLGVLFLGEHLTWNQLLGGLVVLFGVAIGQRIGRTRRVLPNP